MEYKILFVIVLALTFAAAAVISRFLIPVLKSKKMGQRILEIGPRWHKSKEGTPTMGGIAFIIPVILFGVAASVYLWVRDGDPSSALPLVLTLCLGLFGGLIGCIDDMAKLRNKRNEGLTAPQKFLLQVLAAALYLIGMRFFCGMNTELYIPYFKVTFDIGIFYYFFALILICGMMNSVNLTDGIDGLASGVTLVVGVFFAAAGFRAPGTDGGAVVLGGLLIGATAGFLIYNFYPARVFMGDTGSLFLGGLVVGGAFMLRNPLIVVVAGLVYIIETLSVMLQVSYFKLTHGKRLFRMSPIHHHFEQCGWSEIKIVTVFSAVTLLLCVAAYFGL
ncbi:MAG: phospho-N-acetylmuramoyl-pentapeptide-transferase [Clostridia bacterium]|nr:phospho-N-acetylmuramoyl-pentapeptide-transferase [Clostridia bacterium]